MPDEDTAVDEMDVAHAGEYRLTFYAPDYAQARRLTDALTVAGARGWRLELLDATGRPPRFDRDPDWNDLERF